MLSILDPKLTWSEAEQQAAVQQVGRSSGFAVHSAVTGSIHAPLRRAQPAVELGWAVC